MKQPILVSALLIAFTTAGCSTSSKSISVDTDLHGLSSRIGLPVEIQFRRECLGVFREIPLGPDVRLVDGGRTTMSGKLVGVHASAIEIEHEEGLRWVPLDCVLYLDFNPTVGGARVMPPPKLGG